MTLIDHAKSTLSIADMTLTGHAGAYPVINNRDSQYIGNTGV